MGQFICNFLYETPLAQIGELIMDPSLIIIISILTIFIFFQVLKKSRTKKRKENLSAKKRPNKFYESIKVIFQLTIIIVLIMSTISYVKMNFRDSDKDDMEKRLKVLTEKVERFERDNEFNKAMDEYNRQTDEWFRKEQLKLAEIEAKELRELEQKFERENRKTEFLYAIKSGLDALSRVALGDDPTYSTSSFDFKNNIGCNVYGKIKFVDLGEDYKVKFVSVGEDLKIRYVQFGANSRGDWQKVNLGEDYKIRVVSIGEDFKVREVIAGQGCN